MTDTVWDIKKDGARQKGRVEAKPSPGCFCTLHAGIAATVLQDAAGDAARPVMTAIAARVERMPWDRWHEYVIYGGNLPFAAMMFDRRRRPGLVR